MNNPKGISRPSPHGPDRAKAMDQDGWTAVFTLLAITIVVDKRVYKEEVDCFLQQVGILARAIPSETLVTEQLAFDWFFAQQAEVRAKLMGPAGEAYVVRTLHNLLDCPHHILILKAMKAVSVADSDFHIDEVGLIDLAAATWGVSLVSML